MISYYAIIGYCTYQNDGVFVVFVILTLNLTVNWHLSDVKALIYIETPALFPICKVLVGLGISILEILR
jgi:hypothetical protein